MLKNFIKKMRRSAFDFNVVDGRTIGEITLRPLIDESADLLVVDVGARNGMQLLPTYYSANSRLIGFEPNPDEYEKLIAKKTDAHKIGANIPSFKKEEYHPCAIWDSNGDHKFFITVGPGAATLMGETLEQVTGNMYLDYPDNRRFKSFEDLHSKIKETVTVPCRTLDEVLGDGKVCDFLKLDVEGAELRCLKGAQKLLSEGRILFVFTEFVAFPFYSEHCVLGDQHSFLNECGFRLLDIDMGHNTYRRGAQELPLSSDRRLLHAGDAFFCLDPDRNELSNEEKQRIAAICFIFGFNTLALSLLEDAALTTAADIKLIRQAIVDTYTIKRYKHIWGSLPRLIVQKIRGH